MYLYQNDKHKNLKPFPILRNKIRINKKIYQIY